MTLNTNLLIPQTEAAGIQTTHQAMDIAHPPSRLDFAARTSPASALRDRAGCEAAVWNVSSHDVGRRSQKPERGLGGLAARGTLLSPSFLSAFSYISRGSRAAPSFALNYLFFRSTTRPGIILGHGKRRTVIPAIVLHSLPA